MVALIYGVAAVLPFFHTHLAGRIDLHSGATASAAWTLAIQEVTPSVTSTSDCPICLLHQMTSGQLQVAPPALASDSLLVWAWPAGKVSPRQSLLHFASARAPPIA